MMKKNYFAAVGYGNADKTPNFLVFEAEQSGKMKVCQEFYCDGGPSYLITKTEGKQKSIYVALERKNEIAMYEWKQEYLSEKKRVSVPGEGLCHLCISKDKEYIYGSCYMSGGFFAVDSKLESCVWEQTGQEKSHAHCIYQMENKIYMVDLGTSQIRSCFPNDKKEENEYIEFLIGKEEGPRQILTWDSGQYTAVVNECSGTVSFWRRHLQGKDLPAERLCTISTTSYTKNNAPGDAVIWKEKVLFVGNRGAETITAISLEKIGEKLGEWNCGGSFPRGLFMSEEGLLFVSCQKSGNIISYRWNETKKHLEVCDSLSLPGAAGVIEITAEKDRR